MEGQSVADERGRKERKFSEWRRNEALVREECERGGFRTSDENVILQQVALKKKRKEALDNFHLM